MYLNIHVLNGKSSIGIQIFDHLYAYMQSISLGFNPDLQIKFSNKKELKDDAINILFAYMPKSPIDDIDDYDLILLDNGDEPIIVATQIIHDILLTHKNSYLIANSMLDSSHDLHDRIISTFVDCLNFNDYHNRPFYPQYYQQPAKADRKNLFFINGANRAHRWHFLSRLSKHIPDLTVKSAISNVIHETNDCFFESNEDRKFREWLNDHYPITRNAKHNYYDDSISCGIDNKMGNIPPGYFMLDEYYNHNCVIFPESSWINHEFCITEKIIKCFYARTFPLPVAGSHVNQLYKNLGFYTAWNLLPDDLQKYDSIDDHILRYEQICIAINYFNNKPEVFETEQAKRYIDLNQINMLTYKFNLITATKLLDILKNYERRH